MPARYHTLEGRRDAQTEIDQGIAAWTSQRKAVEVMHTLQARGIPAGVVAHPEHQLSDAQLSERGYFRVLDQAALGEIRVEGMGFRGTRLPEPRLALRERCAGRTSTWWPDTRHRQRLQSATGCRCSPTGL